MNHAEIIRLFQEFERYYIHNRHPSAAKIEQFRDFVTEKVNVLNALAQILNKRTGKHVNTAAFTAVDDYLVEKIEKTVKYFFKLERSSPAQ